ncbi:MAG TPA: PQQ-binding-like beta-propeller repeat protein [Acetobacteraceae bacterium]|nr:PQQ-binding-like beta-propeller repeat protein [Acetobacteraceae bacterium]
MTARRFGRAWLWFAAAMLATVGASPLPAAAQDATVPGYHGGNDRAGHSVVPGLTAQTASRTRRDDHFEVVLPSGSHAQPLFWHPPGGGRDLVIVATDDDHVVALDAQSGQTIWQRRLGRPASRAEVSCGNLNPVGVTGTPVIDAAAGDLYLDAMVDHAGAARHMVFGLSLKDGAVLPGWPIAVADALRRRGERFIDRVQEQRGALALADGRVYVPFSGYFGDCGPYHGRVLAFDTARPSLAASWATRGAKGGIWAPAGIVSDGQSIIFVTGNTAGVSQWQDGEAVFRLDPGLHRTGDAASFFTPSNWKDLDDDDLDLGGTNATLIDLPGAQFLLALGKDGDAYLLNRAHLGGIGRALVTAPVADTPIRSATARFRVGRDEIVVVQAHGPSCPGERGLLALRVSASPEPAVARAWCAPLDGQGTPIVTTSDTTADPLVWVLGAVGDDRLHAFDGNDGKPVFASDALPRITQFASILVAARRFYVVAGTRLVAFDLPPSP